MDKLKGLDLGGEDEFGKCAYYWRAEAGKFQGDVAISAQGGIY